MKVSIDRRFDGADSSLSPEATFQATDFGSTRPAWRIRKLAKPTLDMEGSGKQSPKEICTPRFTLLRFTLLLSGMPLSPSHAPQAPPEFARCAVGKTTSFSLTYFQRVPPCLFPESNRIMLIMRYCSRLPQHRGKKKMKGGLPPHGGIEHFQTQLSNLGTPQLFHPVQVKAQS